jgi:SDR family mycofactocin-dependent oxidoreductase
MTTGGRVAGKVALITGAARGQGRSHAVRLAGEGADIIGIDIGADLPEIPYPLGTAEDLDETARLVAETGRTMFCARADVRDAGTLSAAIDEGVDRLGRLDVAVANAGVCTVQPWNDLSPSVWDTVIGVNLTGVWNTCVGAVPHLIEAGGGSIVLISSVAGLKGQPFFAPYTASKHALVGVMRSLAVELATHDIRVNSIHPTGVDTPMLVGLSRLSEYIEANPRTGSVFLNSLPVDLVTASDVSNALVYLASDESRFVTGLTLTVDAGSAAR